VLSLMPLSECGFEIVFVVFCDIRAAEGGVGVAQILLAGLLVF